MPPILLPSLCMGLAVACQLKLVKWLPKGVSSRSAIGLLGLSIYLFQVDLGWWWGVPFCLAEFMIFTFIWLLTKSMAPQLINSILVMLGLATGLVLLLRILVEIS